MSIQPKKKSFAACFALLKLQQGKPPVLSSESYEAYKALMNQLMECLDPQDMMEALLVNDVLDSSWEILRLTRHKRLVIERNILAHQKLQATRLKAESEKQATKMVPARELVERSSDPLNEMDRMFNLEDIVDQSVEDISKLLTGPATELNESRALQASFKYYERLGVPLVQEIARRNIALQMLERHREGLGQRLREVFDQIIETERTDLSASHNQIDVVLVSNTDAPDTPLQTTNMDTENAQLNQVEPPLQSEECSKTPSNGIATTAEPTQSEPASMNTSRVPAAEADGHTAVEAATETPLPETPQNQTTEPSK